MLYSKPMILTLACCSVLAITHQSAIAQSPSGQTERPIVYPSAAIANYQATPLNDVLLSVDVIEAAEIEQSTATTVSDLIAQKTGIEFSRNGGPGAVTSHFMRGQESKNYIMLVDGVRVHTNAIGSLLMPEISIAQVEKIEVLKGNASALYGEAAIGGIINIITKSDTLRDSGFVSTKHGSYNTSEVSAGVSKYINGFNLSFTGTSFETEGYDVRSALSTNPDKDGYRNSNYDFTIERRLSPMRSWLLACIMGKVKQIMMIPLTHQAAPMNMRQTIKSNFCAMSSKRVDGLICELITASLSASGRILSMVNQPLIPALSLKIKKQANAKIQN